MADNKQYNNIVMDWSNTNKAEAMLLFKQQCEMLFRRKKIQNPQDQVDEILLRSGDVGILKFNSWGLSEEDKINPEKIWECFLEYGKESKNFRINRLTLRNLKQKIDPVSNQPEMAEDFVSRLRLQADQCNFRRKKKTPKFLNTMSVLSSKLLRVQSIKMYKNSF